MNAAALFGEFAAALVLVAISGYVLTRQIERLGVRLHFTAGLLGSLVALGADSPELASAIAALMSGHGEVSIGVVLGSNVFNIAGLLGISALLAKNGVVAGRAGLALHGGAALLVTAIAGMLIMRWLPAWAGFALALLVYLPYVVLSSLRPAQLDAWPMLAALRASPRTGAHPEDAQDTHVEAKGGAQNPERATGALLDFLAPVPTLIAVIVGSTLMVARATTIGDKWHLPGAVPGVLILATLTGIPNLIAAISLARHGDGSAAMSEALNSNSLNLVFGLCLPAVFVAPGAPSNVALLALATLLVVTGLALYLSSRRAGLRWQGGLGLLAVYLTFVVAVSVLAY